MRLSFIFFFYLILLFLFLSFNVGSSCCTNLIEETCKNVSQYDPEASYQFCKTSLQAAPASRCANFHELGMIALRLLMNNATDTQCYIRQLLGKKGLDPAMNSTLAICLELSSDGIDDVTNAIKYYTSGDYSGAVAMVSSCLTFSADCEDAFGEIKGLVSPLKKQKEDMDQLCEISLVIIDMQK